MGEVLDDVLATLANKHRRRVLVALSKHNPQQESDLSIPEDVHREGKKLEELQTELFHVHLPMLEDHGYINWDRENHVVTKGANFDELRPYLALIEEESHERQVDNDGPETGPARS